MNSTFDQPSLPHPENRYLPSLHPEMMNPKFGKPIPGGPYIPTRTDLNQMPETPTRAAHHRRAHSETFFRFLSTLLMKRYYSPVFQLFHAVAEEPKLISDLQRWISDIINLFLQFFLL